MGDENHDDPEKAEKEDGPAGLLGLALALFYAVGLATNNQYLSNFGLSDYTLVKPKAIFTGALVIGSLLLISALPLNASSLDIDSDQRWFGYLSSLRSKIAVAAHLFPLSTIIALFFLAALHRDISSLVEVRDIKEGWHLGASEYWRLPLEGVAFFAAACTTAISSIQCVRHIQTLNKKGTFTDLSSWLWRVAGFLTLALVSLAIYINLFVSTFYSYIPSRIGGPGVATMQFKVEEEEAGKLKEIGIPFISQDSTVTKPIYILVENEQDIVIEAPNDRSVSLSVLGFKSTTTVHFKRVIKVEKKLMGLVIVKGFIVSDP